VTKAENSVARLPRLVEDFTDAFNELDDDEETAA